MPRAKTWIVAALSCACGTLMLAPAASAQSAIITQWNFNGLTGVDQHPTPSTGGGSMGPIGGPTSTGFFTGSFHDTTGGGTNQDWSISPFPGQGTGSGTAGAYFAVSTVNFSTISVTLDLRASGTASRYAELQYSVDGGAHWTDGTLITNGNASYGSASLDLSSVTAAEDNAAFQIRVVTVFDPSGSPPSAYAAANPTGTYGPNGTYRFDIVTVSGMPLTPTNPVPTAPAAAGCAGGTSLLTVAVQGGLNPPSTGLSVAADLTGIGGSATQTFYDDGTNGDAIAGDNIFSFTAPIPGSADAGTVNIPVTATDAESRSGSATLHLGVGHCNNAPSTVVISQVYGAGSNAGALLNADYVELFNRSSSTVDLSGHTLQYASAGGSFAATMALTGSIAPGQYFLVQTQAAGTTGFDLPTPDVSPSTGNAGFNMANNTGRVALVHSTSPIGAGCADANLLDLVAYGAAVVCSEGAGPAPVLNASPVTSAGLRRMDGCQDTDNNFNDFTADVPNPRNTASPTHTCGGGGTFNLSVTLMPVGAGSGSVASSPDGINCGTACGASFAAGTSITLTPTAASNSRFVGWTGGCAGAGPCTVVMTQDQTVGATFRCKADANGDGAVNVQDFLSFLQQYAAGSSAADINDDGQINVQDFLSFLQRYASGC
jgi:hypothetical protein